MKPFIVRQPTAEESREHLKKIREAHIEKAEDVQNDATRAKTPVLATAGPEGVFIGQYRPKDRDGNSLGKIFNVYAAPQDLPDETGRRQTFTYIETQKRMAELKNWNGYDGTDYADDRELYKALKEDTYSGGWFIPPRELLAGIDEANNLVQPDNLNAYKNEGALKGTFGGATRGLNHPDFYWSCTVSDEDSLTSWCAFPDGKGTYAKKDILELSCRPMRLVRDFRP